MSVENIVEKCLNLYEDLSLEYVRKWKQENNNAKAIGFLPVYVPREIIHALGMLPVGIMGGGDRIEIIKGDAYYQSYICHLPRSVIEMGLNGMLNSLDGMIFPSICDVIRNLSGIWKLLFKDKLTHYLDLPQNFKGEIGGEFFIVDLLKIVKGLEKLGNVKVTTDKLNNSIELYNENRRIINELYDLRAKNPWQVKTYELYLVIRAGNIVDVSEHNKLMKDYLNEVKKLNRKKLDNAKVVLVGSFCEQPPLGLIKTLENSGCYIVDDDYILGSRFILGDIPLTDNPIKAISNAFLNNSTFTSSKYEGDQPKSELLIKMVKERKADGVILAAPSFCDPALLDHPIYIEALRKANIDFSVFQYAENTGQFQVIREQTGTFSDSIKLWRNV